MGEVVDITPEVFKTPEGVESVRIALTELEESAGDVASCANHFVHLYGDEVRTAFMAEGSLSALIDFRALVRTLVVREKKHQALLKLLSGR